MSIFLAYRSFYKNSLIRQFDKYLQNSHYIMYFRQFIRQKLQENQRKQQLQTIQPQHLTQYQVFDYSKTPQERYEANSLGNNNLQAGSFSAKYNQVPPNSIDNIKNNLQRYRPPSNNSTQQKLHSSINEDMYPSKLQQPIQQQSEDSNYRVLNEPLQQDLKKYNSSQQQNSSFNSNGRRTPATNSSQGKYNMNDSENYQEPLQNQKKLMNYLDKQFNNSNHTTQVGLKGSEQIGGYKSNSQHSNYQKYQNLQLNNSGNNDQYFLDSTQQYLNNNHDIQNIQNQNQQSSFTSYGGSNKGIKYLNNSYQDMIDEVEMNAQNVTQQQKAKTNQYYDYNTYANRDSLSMKAIDNPLVAIPQSINYSKGSPQGRDIENKYVSASSQRRISSQNSYNRNKGSNQKHFEGSRVNKYIHETEGSPGRPKMPPLPHQNKKRDGFNDYLKEVKAPQQIISNYSPSSSKANNNFPEANSTMPSNYQIQQYTDYNNFLESNIDNSKKNDLSLLNASSPEINQIQPDLNIEFQIIKSRLQEVEKKNESIMNQLIQISPNIIDPNNTSLSIPPQGKQVNSTKRYQSSSPEQRYQKARKDQNNQLNLQPFQEKQSIMPHSSQVNKVPFGQRSSSQNNSSIKREQVIPEFYINSDMRVKAVDLPSNKKMKNAALNRSLEEDLYIRNFSSNKKDLEDLSLRFDKDGLQNYMINENRMLKQENEYLKLKIERCEKEIKEKKRIVEDNDAYYKKLFEEKVEGIQVLREENKQLQLQIHNLELKSYDKKKNLQKLYRIITEKDDENKKLKYQLQQKEQIDRESLNQAIQSIEEQLNQKMQLFIEDLAYKERIIENLQDQIQVLQNIIQNEKMRGEQINNVFQNQQETEQPISDKLIELRQKREDLLSILQNNNNYDQYGNENEQQQNLNDIKELLGFIDQEIENEIQFLNNINQQQKQEVDNQNDQQVFAQDIPTSLKEQLQKEIQQLKDQSILELQQYNEEVIQQLKNILNEEELDNIDDGFERIQIKLQHARQELDQEQANKIIELEKKLLIKQDETGRLESQIKELQQLVKKQNKQNSSPKIQNQQQDSRNYTVSAAVETEEDQKLINSLQNQIQKLKQEIQKANTDFNIIKDDNKSFVSQIEILKKQNQLLETQNQNVQKNIQTLEQTIKTLNEQNKSLQKEKESISKNLQQKTQNLAKSEDQVAQFKNENKLYQEKCGILEKRIKELEETKKKSSTPSAGTSPNSKGKNQNTQQQQQQLQQYIKDCEQLKQLLIEYEQKFLEKEEDKSKLLAEIEDLKSKLEEAVTIIKQQEEENEKLKEEIEQNLKRVKDLEKEKEDIANEQQDKIELYQNSLSEN
ncbi:DNA-directed RNA polymerase, omega subunit family protein (macronuclear) [Tetrahymena thermophila SB210]|uniref:DNA-directed RNA polymerase, omega subunit family protein n=1 Tax=Tetrahymena thermophila (strain SB210) TaxID=312017 RepID=Q23DH8_TETTS|nr:DNA-directed RNA polymerase, omega subunit family protein [Tetrahymena thermophila SB210]EAR94460.2 DNA-directed RNA polymerase, omega subunit family protein [Tetrahymena thermophila SB210]|eukprot:XP_001014708.2 DNA-directed RNA polymerase, omega subunit family protein [Tetrahymena thermophila SB210]